MTRWMLAMCCAAFVTAMLVSRSEAQQAPTREGLRGALADLKASIGKAGQQNVPALYAEATLKTGERFVGTQWEKVAGEKRDEWAAYLMRQTRFEKERLDAALNGRKDPREVPPIPDYAKLKYTPGKPYLTLDGKPVLIITAGNSGGGKGDPRYVGKGDLYGVISAVGASRYDYHTTPIWPLYQKDPKSHRVYDGGWCGHIIKDKWSIGGHGGRQGICIISLDYPPMREAVRKAVIQKCERYKKRGNLARRKMLTMDWEFTYMNYDESTKKLWQQWLKDRYRKIGELNKLWKTDIKDFEEVTLPPIQSNREQNPAKYYDYGEFNLWRFTDYLHWAKKVIQEQVPGYPMCVGGGQPFGVQFWKQGVDEEYLGVTGVCDIWLSETGSRSWGTPSFMDLQWSIAPEKLIMDPEYHSTGGYMSLMFFHGCCSLDFYGWPKKEGADFAHGNAMLRGALDVRRLTEYIVPLANARPEAAIFYSRASLIQRHPGTLKVKGRRGVQTPYILELEKCYRAGTILDTGMGFVTSRMAKEGVDSKLKVVIVPGAYFANKDVVKGLTDYAKKGGTLLITPTSMVADEYNRRVHYLKDVGVEIVKETVPKYLAGKARAGVERPGSEYDFIQGPIAPTIVSDEPEAVITPQRRTRIGALKGKGIRQEIKLSGKPHILATFADGKPAIVAKKLGRGEVIYLAMQLDEPDMRRFLDWVYNRVNLTRHVRLTTPDGGPVAGIESRTIPYQQGYITYLYNLTDGAMAAKLQPVGRTKISRIENLTASAPMKPGDTIPLGPYEWVVLKLEK